MKFPVSNEAEYEILLALFLLGYQPLCHAVLNTVPLTK
jgi:hypothetical protein